MVLKLHWVTHRTVGLFPAHMDQATFSKITEDIKFALLIPEGKGVGGNGGTGLAPVLALREENPEKGTGTGWDRDCELRPGSCPQGCPGRPRPSEVGLRELVTSEQWSVLTCSGGMQLWAALLGTRAQAPNL